MKCFVCLFLLAGCSSGGGNNGPLPDLALPPTPGWTLSGTLSGFTLQNEAVSGEAHTVSGSAVLVQLSSRSKICDLLQLNSCPNGRILGFRVGATVPGSFTVVDKEQPASGEAHIFFIDLDSQCLENSRVDATQGTLTVHSSTDSLYYFSFDATTPEGPISGEVAAAFCQI